MANAVLTTSERSAYDDQPELRYHFPRTYLNQVQAALGDWIVYYEPRRALGQSDATGRQAYFAIARIASVEADPRTPGHYYARIADYVEFDQPVPFREGQAYYESGLQKVDGSTNKGAFGRSVRVLPVHEFSAIVTAGFARETAKWEQAATSAADEGPLSYEVRPHVSQVVTRPFRDAAFRRHVREAYDSTCAISGLRLINGGGRPEVQAAHIVPVAEQGPDSVRNGIALTGTLHWLFDRGLMSLTDDHRVLIASKGLPEGVGRLVQPGARIQVPHRTEWQPHPTFIRWHREHCFKG